MTQVRNSDLHKERENIRERVNESKIKYFNFLIHSLWVGKWRYSNSKCLFLFINLNNFIKRWFP